MKIVLKINKEQKKQKKDKLKITQHKIKKSTATKQKQARQTNKGDKGKNK